MADQMNENNRELHENETSEQYTAPQSTASQNTEPQSAASQQDAASGAYSAQSYGAYYSSEYQTPYGNQQNPCQQSSYGQSPYGQQNPYSQQVWQNGQTNGQTVWDGSTYHYSQQAPQPPQPKKPKEKKPMGRGKRFAVKLVAAVLACVLVSGGSIAAFAALINGGYITVSNTGSTTPAFTINKMVNDEDGSTASQTTTTGELSLNEIAEKVIPSVVCVQNYQKTNQGYYFGQIPDTEAEEEDAGEGSGIIATSDGYIITNAHVVDGADSLKVVLYDGSTYEATLVGSDNVTDLAVIKIEATNLVPATFGSSEDLEVADQVMAIGNPGGLQFSSSVTVGYVSALNRPITTEDGYTMECIQTDAAINPGNSGGALVNMYGQVVGINSSKIAATGYEGLGFAIPIDTAQPIISSLKEYGYVKDRAVLGITGQYIDSMTARFYGYPTAGMYVASVTNPSVSSAGITQGCLITKIDDVTVDSQSAITSYLVSKKAGDTVTLEVYNGLSQQTFTVEVTLAESTGE